MNISLENGTWEQQNILSQEILQMTSYDCLMNK